jgi:hypothetical protein
VVNFDWAIKTSDGTSQSFSNNLHWPEPDLQSVSLHGLESVCCRDLELNIERVAGTERTLSRSISRNFSGYMQMSLKFSLATWNPQEMAGPCELTSEKRRIRISVSILTTMIKIKIVWSGGPKEGYARGKPQREWWWCKPSKQLKPRVHVAFKQGIKGKTMWCISSISK